MESSVFALPAGWKQGQVLDVAAFFDAPHYLDIYEDVRESTFDALEHYRNFGFREGRQPAPWFDADWYVGHYLRDGIVVDDQAFDPFVHFCLIGNPLGLSPNREVEYATLQAAAAVFDPEQYVAVNTDVAEAGADPWEHFRSVGWLEGRSPAPDFDMAWYSSMYLAPVVAEHAPQPALTANAFFHYVLLGRERGCLTHPSQLPEPEPVPEALPAPVELAPVKPAPDYSDIGARMIAFVTRGNGDPAPEATGADEPHTSAGLPDAPLSDEALLNASPLFNTHYYRAMGGQGDDRLALIRHYLSEGAAAGLEPSPEFGSVFYRQRYGTVPKTLESLRLPADEVALLHYLRVGRPHGFYPNAQIASLEIEVIRASGTFAADAYLRQIQRRAPIGELIADYAFFGHVEGLSPRPGFDGAFVRALYAPLTGETIHAPLAFCLRNAHRPWVLNSADELRHEAQLVRDCPLFNADFYVGQAGIDPDNIDPAAHFCVIGIKNGLPASPEFDTEFYLARNADIAAVRVNPLLHYQNYGRAEGRVCLPNSGVMADAARRTFEPDRKTVIVFSHEASRSGAPIVALNVARKLAEDHNVVVWIGTPEGPLLEEFGAVAIRVQTGWGSISGMTQTLLDLRDRYGCAYAVVNSVVCHAAIAPLRRAGIISVSLIHEFANYVYPAGTLSRMALFSDATVFPAKMVQDACIEEMARIGIRTIPAHLKIRPQGYNAARSGKAAITTDEVRETIGLNSAAKGQRVLFGAGQVQPRKGVDLFLQAAQQLQARGEFDWRFVWVGSGYDPAMDMTTSVYLAHQIRESGLQDRFTLFDEQTSLDPFWDVADVFFMSSRLDPFPNVALDAMERHIPVVCFKGGTGIAELEPRFPFAARAVTFADPGAAADAISAFAADQAATKLAFEGAPGDALREALSFDSYVADIGAMADAARSHHDSVSLVSHFLEAIPQSDVAQAVRRIPASFRLSSFADKVTERLTLAAHLVDQPLALGVMMDAQAGILELVPARDGVCSAAFGRAPGPLPPSEHIVHLHFNDTTMAEVLFSPRHWAARSLSLSSLVVTVSDYKVALALHGLLPPKAHMLRETFADGAAALMHVAGEPRSALGAVSGLEGTIGANTITHCTLTADTRPGERRNIGRETLDCLSGLISGASLEALGTRPDVAAVVPALLQDDASGAVRALFGPDQPETHAPAFAGTYRRSDLLAFRQGRFARFASAARLTKPAERMAFAALLFSADMSDAGRRIVTALNLN